MESLRNTKKSEKTVKKFLERNTPFKRKEQTYKVDFSFSAGEVFREFCPSREEDWIDGWTADLIYTSSGYAESDCVFSTPSSNILGPGLWIFTKLKPDQHLEVIRIIENSVIVHFRIELENHDNNTCTGIWKLKFTALNEQGNKMIDNIPERDPMFEKIIEGLQYFLEKGEAIKLV
ncbi:hypothetical protein [Abyssalbus ytuae]|uniref:Uncharacterized protein n=1 Tax=Abyssalbus ytuae TaxID=2926907 RepID=A0A9E6ZVN6_9FLAO|nr:hypothetical protein [Abyssalbus ytuae]UOB18628.1 hypothetical protein MQE35_04900 [Abyssalbus ytuae]